MSTMYEKPKRIEYIPLYGYFAMKLRLRRIQSAYNKMNIYKPPALMSVKFKMYHYYTLLIIVNLFVNFGMKYVVNFFYP